MQIAVEITGIAEAIAQMNRISSVARNLTPLHRHIGNIIQNSIEQSFEDEKSPFGSTWTPSKKDNGKTLTDSGTLSSSFSVDADRNSVSVGTNLVYAAIHQYGGQAGRNRSVTLPERPFLPVSNSGELEEGVRGEIMQYLVRSLGV